MSGERLSAATQALLKAAKSDAPGAAARAKVWSGVSATVGGAAGAAASAGGGAAAGAGMSAAKMLTIGTLLGGTVTVGIASMLLYMTPARGGSGPAAPAPAVTVQAAAAAPTTDDPTPDVHPAFAASPLESEAPPGASRGPGAMPGGLTGAVASPPAAAAAAPRAPSPPPSPAAASHRGGERAHEGSSGHGGGAAPPRGSAGSGGTSTPDDALTREASLVAQARTLLAHGDAAAALRTVRAARAMPSPQLVPEELAVEAQALRSLGQADDARGVDTTLRTQYPDSDLAP